MAAKVIRYCDYEKKSRQPDAVDRDPADSAVIIILPVVRIERYEETKLSFGAEYPAA